MRKMVDAGKFFMLGFGGTRVPASLQQWVKKYGLGGAILFDRNIETPEQVTKLTRELKNLSSDFLISIDQEGGKFQRLKPPLFGAYPPACEVTLETAYDVGSTMGRELAALGINFDNAPVLDVNSNPKNPIIGNRSFSADPKLVAQMGQLFVQGFQDNHVIACGKHFPGHGDTSQDSHLTLPVVKKTREALEAVEFYPFRELMRHNQLPSIMTAHVVYTALDPDLPATFSKKIMIDLLRKEWGYKGVVITDDLGMAGALSRGDLPDVCIEAFTAGCDLLLVCDHHERHEELIEALAKAIAQSDPLKKRAQESLERIACLF
jgi:beta-N-acetylhexosaminidase